MIQGATAIWEIVRKYPWLGWVVALALLAHGILRPQKTLVLTEYKERLVIKTVTSATISGTAHGGTTTVTPQGMTNEGGDVDWSSSIYSDSSTEFQEDSKQLAVNTICRPFVFIGPSLAYVDTWYAEMGLGIRIYGALYLTGGVGTKDFTGMDSYRAGVCVAF